MARRSRAARRCVVIRHVQQTVATSRSGYCNLYALLCGSVAMIVIGALIVTFALFAHLQMGQERLERMAEKNQQKTVEAILEVTKLHQQEFDRRENLSEARYERLEKRMDATNERLLQLARSSKQNQNHVQAHRGSFGERTGAAIGGAIQNTLVGLAKTALRLIF